MWIKTCLRYRENKTYLRYEDEACLRKKDKHARGMRIKSVCAMMFEV